MEIQTKYNPKEVEKRTYQSWLADGSFSGTKDPNKKPFSVVIPPPNVTGILHMGHALNNTIQDVLIRFKKLRGYQTLWMPGTDHAGIATQNVVEKTLAQEGLTKEDIGRAEFLKRLWKWKEEYGSTILQQLKELGTSCDWDRTRFTMDDDYSEAVKETFIRLYEKGLIYRGNYIINWCPRCKTALSDEEAPYKEIDGWLYHIKYPVRCKESQKKTAPDHIVVATTRPETMLGDTAVAINPKDKRYRWLKGAEVTLPVVNRKLEVIEDELVDPDFGTGVVKVTPAHDPADFILAKNHNLEFINIMEDNALLNRNAGEFAGMDRFEARQALLEVLEEKKLIEKKEPYTLNAGHCYRCHTIIEPRLSLQWFVKMKPLAQAAIKVVEEDRIRFYPGRWKKVYLNWMYNIQDWCISRQIWWGHRIPVYYCTQCHSQEESRSKTTEEQIDKGLIVSGTKPAQCPQCGSKELIEETDVLDTWFSSWLWPFATFGWPFNKSTVHSPQSLDTETQKEEFKYFYPTGVLVTASEILFFWVARMIMAGMEFTGEIPFSDVLIHGTVRDEKGIKMSKSLGNIIDPLEIIDAFGADPLRFSLMLLCASGSDIYLSNEKFLVGRNFCNKLWNATRFLLANVKQRGFTITDLEISECDFADSWIIDELDKTIGEVTRFFEKYQINEAAKKLYEFFWHAYCDWYIEMTKDNFSLAKAKVALHCLISVLKLLHPIIPFITEEIFTILKKTTGLPLEKTILEASYPTEQKLKGKERMLAQAHSVIDLIKAIRNLKLDLGLNPSKKITVIITAAKDHATLIESNKTWIGRLANVETIKFSDRLGRVLFENANLRLDVALDAIDEGSFVSSLDKRLGEVNNLLSNTTKKLANKRFTDNAPAEIVARERQKQQHFSLQLERLKKLRNAFI